MEEDQIMYENAIKQLQDAKKLNESGSCEREKILLSQAKYIVNHMSRKLEEHFN